MSLPMRGRPMNLRNMTTRRQSRPARTGGNFRLEALESRALMSADYRFASTNFNGGLGAATAVAVDSAGNTFVTGAFQGSTTFGTGASAVTLTSGSNSSDS